MVTKRSELGSSRQNWWLWRYVPVEYLLRPWLLQQGRANNTFSFTNGKTSRRFSPGSDVARDVGEKLSAPFWQKTGAVVTATSSAGAADQNPSTPDRFVSTILLDKYFLYAVVILPRGSSTELVVVITAQGMSQSERSGFVMDFQAPMNSPLKVQSCPHAQELPRPPKHRSGCLDAAPPSNASHEQKRATNI